MLGDLELIYVKTIVIIFYQSLKFYRFIKFKIKEIYKCSDFFCFLNHKIRADDKSDQNHNLCLKMLSCFSCYPLFVNLYNYNSYDIELYI